MGVGSKYDMGNGFVFHITSENQSGKSWLGYMMHKSCLQPIAQTSMLKEFVKNNPNTKSNDKD